MLLDVLGLLSACSYALDCVEAELVHVSDKHAKRVAYMSVCMAEQLEISGESLQDLAACALLHDNDHFVCLLFVSVGGENAVCPAEKGIKKALHPQRGTKDKQFRGTTHIRHNNAALFRIQIYPIPLTEEIRQRLIRYGSAPQLRRELHRAGVCVRFQSCRTLPESRTWNDYFPLSSLCAIFVLIISLRGGVVND